MRCPTQETCRSDSEREVTMCLNAFEEFDLEDQKRKASRKELRLESRRQRREAIRRLESHIRALLDYQQSAPVDCYESPTRLD